MHILKTASESLGGAMTIAHWIRPLVDQASIWEDGSRQIYLKAFLTVEVKDALETFFPERSLPIPEAVIHWDTLSLTNVIRRRVSAATDGKLGELSGVADRNIRSIETDIISKLPENKRWPREVVKRTAQLLDICFKRCESKQLQDCLITLEDINNLNNKVKEYRRVGDE